MFKAIVLSGFIIGTTMSVQTGYETLLASLDSLMRSSYGVLAETDDAQLRSDSQEITDRYRSVRQNY